MKNERASESFKKLLVADVFDERREESDETERERERERGFAFSTVLTQPLLNNVEHAVSINSVVDIYLTPSGIESL